MSPRIIKARDRALNNIRVGIPYDAQCSISRYRSPPLSGWLFTVCRVGVIGVVVGVRGGLLPLFGAQPSPRAKRAGLVAASLPRAALP